MEFTRCFRCMEDSRGFPCRHCGYDPKGERPKEYVLRPGTILNGKYVVGTLLGQGGFGITYIGWDLLLDSKVAIKEYFPAGQVGRGADGTLQWYSTPTAEAARDSGKEMFLKEARKMSRLREIPQVVHIRDLFQQNGTAYIVMDFVEGQTLKAYLDKTGPLSWEKARAIFFPAIRAMEQVHREGLVHRDLSPDNLMLLPDGGVKILDLGAAKDLSVNAGASSMQVAKGGFSPLEQYTQRGGSGPWSDVYAMAATMYYSLTGILPPPVMDRMEDDQIRWDMPGLKDLPKPALEALKKAMVLLPKARTQTMGEFLNQLEKGQTKQKRKPVKKGKRKKSPLPAIAAVLAVALVAGWVLLPRQEAEPQLESQPQTETQTEAPPETETTVPAEPESIFPLSIQEQTIAAGYFSTVAIKNDGSAIFVGSNEYGEGFVSEWEDLVTISTSNNHTVGLRSDGTVVARGLYGTDVSDWTDIVAISAGGDSTVGLKADGAVVITGTDYDVSDWRNIVAVDAGGNHAVGLRSNGTVIATGNNECGQCNVSAWTNIAAISAGSCHTVGLRADGTVVATGANEYGQCDVSDWTDIIAVSAEFFHTVGLKADGTVVATGCNRYGECDLTGWTDIIAICTGGHHTVGLRADGTLVAVGNMEHYQCNVSDWTDIRVPGTTQTPESPAPADINLRSYPDIVDFAYELKDNVTTEKTYCLFGTVTSIDFEWSDEYQNITVTIVAAGREDKPIQCYRLTGDGAKKLKIGDAITVEGYLTSYYGTKEFTKGCILVGFGDHPLP